MTDESPQPSQDQIDSAAQKLMAMSRFEPPVLSFSGKMHADGNFRLEIRSEDEILRETRSAFVFTGDGKLISQTVEP